MKIEVFLSKSGQAQVIGVGYILLQDLLKDPIEVNSGTVKSVIHVMSSSMPNIQIATLRYRMRLRNSMT